MSVEKESRPQEREVWFPSRIIKPYFVTKTIEDYGEALLIDNFFILAYKKIRGKDKIFIGRERTIPAKKIYYGKEMMWNYPNEEELKGTYGVLMFEWAENESGFPLKSIAVNKAYEVILESTYDEDEYISTGRVKVSSTGSLTVDYINGAEDYNKYLKRLHEQIRATNL